ncbi:uncharacterized protein JCM10292_004552 [Rhodotorula paludigena]|uniref:uncharacterized protein n=1 Tax=Rhodotorula paludigena TaxID=86838 RepID=UPI00316B7656
MSHFDAPLRSRRHSDPPPAHLRHRKSANRDDLHFAAPDALNDSTASSSSAAFPRTQLRALLLPRRVSQRANAAQLSAPATHAEPRHYATDSSFRLHRQFAKRQQAQPGADEYEARLDAVGADTNCATITDGFTGTQRTLLRYNCVRRRAQARSERYQQEEAASSSSSAAAATSRVAARPSRSSVSAAARTISARMQTTTRAPAVTPRVAAPLSTSLNPSQQASSFRAALDSYVESQFADAASVVSSRAAAATASSTTTSASSSSSSTTTSSSSPSSTTSSSSSSLPPPSSTSSGANPTSTIEPAQSDSNRIAKIAGPSIAIPLGLLLLALLAWFCLRRRRRNAAAAAGAAGYSGATGRSTPGIGPISNPQPLQAQPRQYGAMAQYGGPSGGGMGLGPALGAGAGAGALAGAIGAGAAAGGKNSSQESVGTTPSAIGVAFSEPRTKWGRRSLVDVLAGGVRGANSGSNTPTNSAGGSIDPNRVVSGSSSFGGGRQPSIVSLASAPSEYRGVGGYNSFGYQPGQLRPVREPSTPQHYDPFGPSFIVAVPASAQRAHPISSEEGSISGYGGSGSSHDSVSSRYAAGSNSGESITQRLAPALAGGYAHDPRAQQSRTTQVTQSGESEGFVTADPGQSSYDEHEEELSDEGLRRSPQTEAVNFGSGSSGSASGSGSGSGRSMSHISEDPSATPRLESRGSTPRLGAGHGSFGNRRNDGTGSWWN